ncbi:MAG TPA: GNAT family N-acetyltransferase [Solirubrobacteraceae bacterium]|jgi:GNAT superfamily N-acetyltransferase
MSPEDSAVLVRPVTSPEELAAAFDAAGAQLTPPLTRADRRCRELLARIPEDRSLMLVAEHRGRIVGAALGFRKGDGVTLRVIGVEPSVRGQGLGRRLMAAFELAAIRLGATAISLGADADVAGFYCRLGYAGRGPMMHRALPLPGRFLEERLRRPETTAGEPGGSPDVA